MNTEKTKIEVNEATKSQQKTVPATSLAQDIFYLFLKIAAIVVVAVLLFTFVFGVHRVTDISMNPAMQDGDVAIFYRLDKEYVATDSIVVVYEGEKQVRRVVAVAGDVVDITEHGLLINGSLIQESNIYEETLRYEEGIAFSITVGSNQVFVLGDGRGNSIDSRLYGTVEIKDTLGKVMTLIRRRNI